MSHPQPTLIQEVIEQDIRHNPEVAAREIPQIFDHYITNNTLLNLVYQAACLVLIQPNAINFERLRLAVVNAAEQP